MSRSLGDRLPAAVVALLDGAALRDKAHQVFLLVTPDADGYPRPAMLSVGEVLARGPRELRLALYSSSTASANLRRAGKLTLALANDGFGYYVKAAARELAVMDPELAGLATFDATVEEVLEDGEAIAVVTSGFTMRLAGDPARTIAMWESTIDRLRAMP
ncbi:MAG TPA: pyridoxamine 5-phosphate oxidase [Chloroflexota bacterium]|nr:pyridoxamine 5-phosphate oxidase [Chloroflexota bacterium]